MPVRCVDTVACHQINDVYADFRFRRYASFSSPPVAAGCQASPAAAGLRHVNAESPVCFRRRLMVSPSLFITTPVFPPPVAAIRRRTITPGLDRCSKIAFGSLLLQLTATPIFIITPFSFARFGARNS